jgi:RecA/RadA recombinase
MSSDTGLPAEQIIYLYRCRFKIEVMFDDLKNDFGGFRYHFWTEGLAKRKRGRTAVTAKGRKDKELVFKAKKAIEVYVCLHI